MWQKCGVEDNGISVLRGSVAACDVEDCGISVVRPSVAEVWRG